MSVIEAVGIDKQFATDGANANATSDPAAGVVGETVAKPAGT